MLWRWWPSTLSTIPWILGAIVLSGVQAVVVLYNAFRIAVDVAVFVGLGFAQDALSRVACWCWSRGTEATLRELRERLERAESFSEWLSAAEEVDALSGAREWRSARAPEFDLLSATAASLRSARERGDGAGVLNVLSSALDRSFGGQEAPGMFSRSLVGTRAVLEEFLREVSLSVGWVAARAQEGGLRVSGGGGSASRGVLGFSESGTSLAGSEMGEGARTELSAEELSAFLEAARVSVGRTALCLSGGGALSMYHLGVVRALLERRMLPRVVSGTSGGSIVAALLALHTDEELLASVLRPEMVSRHPGYTWFDPPAEQVGRFAWSLLTQEHPAMMESERFARTCRKYLGWSTFADAFRRTGRVVSIAITVRYAGSAHAAHPMVLNYLTSPAVYIWSAVAASCALPGLMPASTLLVRGADGRPHAYHPRGVQSIDGSIHSDVPTAQLARLFHVNRFIVSQVNPHVAPFLLRPSPDDHSPSDAADAAAALPGAPSAPDLSGGAAATSAAPDSAQSAWDAWRSGRLVDILGALRLWLAMDVSFRARRLARLRLLPRMFGQDISGVFLQRYAGNVTITPRMGLLDKFHALSHPTEADMRRYIAEGQRSVWPHLPHIHALLAMENALSDAVHAIRAHTERHFRTHQPDGSRLRLNEDEEGGEDVEGGVDAPFADAPTTDAPVTTEPFATHPSAIPHSRSHDKRSPLGPQEPFAKVSSTILGNRSRVRTRTHRVRTTSFASNISALESRFRATHHTPHHTTHHTPQNGASSSDYRRGWEDALRFLRHSGARREEVEEAGEAGARESDSQPEEEDSPSTIGSPQPLTPRITAAAAALGAEEDEGAASGGDHTLSPPARAAETHARGGKQARPWAVWSVVEQALGEEGVAELPDDDVGLALNH